jgi:hypothetical protein
MEERKENRLEEVFRKIKAIEDKLDAVIFRLEICERYSHRSNNENGSRP